MLVQVDLSDSHSMETGIRHLLGEVVGDELFISGLKSKPRRQFHVPMILAPAKNRNTIVFHLSLHALFDHPLYQQKMT